MATLTLMATEHVPVLTEELIEHLDPRFGEDAIDATFGGGGHARAVASRVGESGSLLCIDRDPAARERFHDLATELGCDAELVAENFADAIEDLAAAGRTFDIVYMDLGVSSFQIDAAERGFSYSYDAPLDMRMDPLEELDAATVVNEWPEARLATTLRELGEERHSRSIAMEIVRRRPLESTAQLVDAIRAAVPPAYRFGRGHPAKRSFQAIRIAVNDELTALDRALPPAWELLRVGGRMAAISFHSLEDRRVKRFFASLAKGCVCPPELPVCICGHEPEAELVTRRAVKPGPAEIERNPRSASARLRVARKLATGGGAS